MKRAIRKAALVNYPEFSCNRDYIRTVQEEGYTDVAVGLLPDMRQFTGQGHRLSEASYPVRRRVAHQIMQPKPPCGTITRQPPRPAPAAPHPDRFGQEIFRQVFYRGPDIVMDGVAVAVGGMT